MDDRFQLEDEGSAEDEPDLVDMELPDDEEEEAEPPPDEASAAAEDPGPDGEGER